MRHREYVDNAKTPAALALAHRATGGAPRFSRWICNAFPHLHAPYGRNARRPIDRAVNSANHIPK
jgi:hypothetical protein